MQSCTEYKTNVNGLKQIAAQLKRSIEYTWNKAKKAVIDCYVQNIDATSLIN